MVKNDFYFYFYQNEASSDMLTMNFKERGAYLTLILLLRSCICIAQQDVCRTLGNDFDEIWPRIRHAFTEENGLFYIQWLKESAENRKNYVNSRAENAKHGWEKRHMHMHSISNAQSMLPVSESVSDSVTEAAKGGKGGKPKPAPAPRPYFDAVVEVFDFKAIVATQKGPAQVGALARDFKAMCEVDGKDHTEIARMAERYKAANPGKPLNPYFLKTSWPQLKNIGSTGKPGDPEMKALQEKINAREALKNAQG